MERGNKRSLVDSSVKIAALIRELNIEALTNGAVVIVEGKRDEAALRAAGYTGPLIKVKTLRMTLQRAASKIGEQHKKAILLLDYDKQGKLLAEKLGHFLEHEGVDVNYVLRETLYNLLDGDIREIEELSRYVPLLQTGDD